ncbi:MAG: phytoene/squalene synthase family protein [Solirubrobacteraceae bacterium]
MKQLFDALSEECSQLTTKKYSTSFSLGILFLHKKLRNPIYSIYGYVRFADEIVDSFHGFDKKLLLEDFKKETYRAIESKISLNPIINSFQSVVNQYKISPEMIDAFYQSMEMDLEKKEYTEIEYQKYIYGSAEVVGLMCLRVFTENNEALYNKLLPAATRLGSAFQKVNFLRDLRSDNLDLGRTYFPKVDLTSFNPQNKISIEKDITQDFKEALSGILQLPSSSKKGVFLAYYYYFKLFKKIKKLSPEKIMEERIRISNPEKYFLLIKSNIKLQLSAF